MEIFSMPFFENSFIHFATKINFISIFCELGLAFFHLPSPFATLQRFE